MASERRNVTLLPTLYLDRQNLVYNVNLNLLSTTVIIYMYIYTTFQGETLRKPEYIFNAVDRWEFYDSRPFTLDSRQLTWLHPGWSRLRPGEYNRHFVPYSELPVALEIVWFPWIDVSKLIFGPKYQKHRLKNASNILSSGKLCNCDKPKCYSFLK